MVDCRIFWVNSVRSLGISGRPTFCTALPLRAKSGNVETNPVGQLCARSRPGDFRRRFLPQQPSGTEAHGQPAPIALQAIKEVFLEVCGRNIRDKTSQLRDQSLCLVSLAPKAT
jgi:hypothetical protein